MKNKLLFGILFFIAVSCYCQDIDSINSNRITYKKYFVEAFDSNPETSKYKVYFSKGLELIYEEESLMEKEGLLWSQSINSSYLIEESRRNQIYLTIKNIYESFGSDVFFILDNCGIAFIYFQYNNPCYFDKETENKNLQYNYMIEVESFKKNQNNFSEKIIKSIIIKI